MLLRGTIGIKMAVRGNVSGISQKDDRCADAVKANAPLCYFEDIRAALPPRIRSDMDATQH